MLKTSNMTTLIIVEHFNVKFCGFQCTENLIAKCLLESGPPDLMGSTPLDEATHYKCVYFVWLMTSVSPTNLETAIQSQAACSYMAGHLEHA